MNKYRLWYLIKQIPRIPKNIFNEVKWFFQRGKRGWSDRDTWSLDHYICGIFAGSLLFLANKTYGHPCRMIDENNFPGCCNSCNCSELWDSELRENAEKFKKLYEEYYILKLSDTDPNWAEQEQKTYKEVTEWLVKWFGNLWW